MRKSLMIGLTTLTAACLLAAAVGTATAGRLETNSSTYRVTWRELVFGGGTACEVTLEGSFHSRTITKIRGALIGLVTKARVRHPCVTASEEFWTDNENERPIGRNPTNRLPWHLTYEGFLGRLPTISGIVLVIRNVSIVLLAAGGLCQGRYGTATDNLNVLAEVDASGNLTRLDPVAGRAILNLRELLGGGICPERLEFEGSGTVTQLNATTRINIRLI